MLLYFIIFLIMMLGGLVRGMSGFGSGLVCMSILPLVMDYKQALPIMYIASAAISLQLVLKTHKHINWRVFLIPAIFSVIGKFISMYAIINLNSDILKIILGVIIIFVAIYQLAYSNRITIKPNFRNGAIAGTSSGILGGLAGVGGLPLAVYCMNCDLEKEVYFSTLQMNYLLGNLLSITLMAAAGGYTGGILPYIFAIAGILAGSFVGSKIFGKVSHEGLKKIINFVLIGLGILIFTKTIIGFIF